jgi:hypothetical protein
MAEGAVRPLVAGRLTPQAAYKRLESICGESFSSLIVRMVLRSASACMSGPPPSFSRRGKAMPVSSAGFTGAVCGGLAQAAAKGAAAAPRMNSSAPHTFCPNSGYRYLVYFSNTT